jgi:hypothetical protein
LTNRLRKCDVYIPWNSIQSQSNEILSFAGKWMQLENIILSEISQGQKAKKLHAFSHMENIDLLQISHKQNYVKQDTPRGGHT